MRANECESVSEIPDFGEQLDDAAAQAEENDIELLRQQFELLIEHALYLSGGNYGFVLSPAGTNGFDEQFVKLRAVVERDENNHAQPCYDTLSHCEPDPMVQAVMRLRRAIKGTPADIGMPLCVPGSHPPIRYFMMVPIASGTSRTSILFIANPDRDENEVCHEELIKKLTTLCQRLSERRKIVHDSTPSPDPSPQRDDDARHYVQLMNAALNAIVIVDPVGAITAFNPAAETLFGCDSKQALGNPFDRYLPQEFLMPILRRARSFDNLGTPNTLSAINQRSVNAICESGKSIALRASAYFTSAQSTVYTTFVFEHESINSDKADQYLGTHQHFKALTNVAPVGILQLSSDWTCEYANDMWCQLSGLSMEESIGEGWVDAIYCEDVVDTLVDLRTALGDNRIFNKNIRLQSPTGAVSWVSFSGTATINELSYFTGCLLVLLDVTETHKASERLLYAATHDVLTGLSNRSSFLEKLQQRLDSSSSRLCTALLYLDLDGFKTINDTLGHGCGDELLRQVASRLKELLSTSDICARIGGDEFTIALTSTSANDLQKVCALAESICRSFNQTYDVFGNDLHVTSSIGISIADEQTSNCDVFIKQADTALYKAKASGRSRWVVYSREIRNEDIQRSALKARIRRATERREFTLVYQPQFRIDDQSFVSFEALLRWAPTDIAAPDTELLISVLEDSGLINDVGQWVLESACQQYRQWRDSGLIDADCTMSVNVSPAQLNIANFALRLTAILKRCNVAADRLNLEITESALIEKNSSCIRVINDIKALGVTLSLDDFGTGYASLSYLTRLPIDFLKIDKSFVMAMEKDDSSRTIVMSVLALAGTLDIDVIAEGIETLDILEQLRGANCKYGQGFLVSKPRKASELEPLLVRKRYLDSDVILLN